MRAPLPPRRFQPLRTAVLRLAEAGDYRGALPIALEAQAAFPAHGEVPFWLACIHCRLGDSAAALAALRAGLARGHYWPGDWLLGDDDMAPLRGSLELKAVVRESERARAAAARPGVLRPVGLDPPGPPGPPGGVAETAASPRAVVVALHGWGQDAEEFALHWQAAVENGFRVLVPRSSQQPTPGFFVWDDREAARADVTAQLRSAPGSGQPRTSAVGSRRCSRPASRRAAGSPSIWRSTPIPSRQSASSRSPRARRIWPRCPTGIAWLRRRPAACAGDCSWATVTMLLRGRAPCRTRLSAPGWHAR